MKPSMSRRVAVRSELLICAASVPVMRIDPPNPPSSRPTAWSKVDLPEPEGPSNATISPGAIDRFTPRRTWIVSPPCSKLRVRPVVARTASLIAKHLDRIGAGGARCRIERREEGQQQGDRHDHRDLDRI